MAARMGFIYGIVNSVNGKVYIGSAVDLDRRIREHIRALKRFEHWNPHLQASVDKYGLDAFIFMVVDYVDVNRLIPTEQLWMDDLQPEYNMLPATNNRLGVLHSEKGKARMRGPRNESDATRTAKAAGGRKRMLKLSADERKALASRAAYALNAQRTPEERKAQSRRALAVRKVKLGY